MTDKEVRDAVRRWVAGVLGITVIHSHQGGGEPAEPYGVFNLMMADSVRQHLVEYEYPSEGTGEDEVIRQASVYEWFWKFSVNVYGDEGGTILRKLRTVRDIPQAVDSLRPLIVFETSQIRNVPELLNEEWQARSQIDIEIRGIVRDGYVIDVAETTQPIILIEA